MKTLKFFGFVLLSILLMNACKTEVKKQEQKKGDYLFAFYNVENLFDTIDDPNINDEEFTPQAKVPWTKKRYEHKLQNLAKAISTIDDKHMPDIVGLCEVENKGVVMDLLDQDPLNKPGYSFIHKDSPDERGIDVALLFKPKVFKPIYAKFIPIRFPFDTSERTRDVLYVKGIIDNDTLHLFVNHWTSRWGGQQETEEFRVHTAGILAGYVDSLVHAVRNPKIIMMGDFNDNPDNISIAETLNAKLPQEEILNNELYNLSWQPFKDGEGSIYWKSWDMFDQFIVSGVLDQTGNGLHITPFREYIHKPDFMLFEDSHGVKRPNRTKSSKTYFGGFSDHLPAYIYLSK